MKKLFLFGVWFAAALFVGCDESGTSANADESSSSVAVSGKSAESNGSSSSYSNENMESSSSQGGSLSTEIVYGSLTDSRDGQVYKTVKIGDQTWMAENLNYADSVNTPSLKDGNWCYDNKNANCDVAGRLYTWAAAIDSVKLANDAENPQDCGYCKTCTLPETVQGICPEGWHLPSRAEWQTLFTAAGGQSSAGKVLKSGSGWKDYFEKSGNGTDALGFSAIPVGLRRYYNGNFIGDDCTAYFWSSTEYDRLNAYYMLLFYDDERADLLSYYKDYAFSIRCLKDE